MRHYSILFSLFMEYIQVVFWTKLISLLDFPERAVILLFEHQVTVYQLVSSRINSPERCVNWHVHLFCTCLRELNWLVNVRKTEFVTELH